MQEKQYSIQTIIKSVFKEKNHTINKRLIYDNAQFGGLSNKWIKLAFLILPFAMYAAIFNPVSFKELGIAQAIVFYIILLVFAMQIVVAVSYFNNKKVLKTAAKAWEAYFPGIDFKMILSSGVTPYADFKKYYESALTEALEEDALKARMTESFQKMEMENIHLVEAMKKDKEKKEGK
ncbi:hypothetical protein TSL6_18880 [Sulfurovum sp. TSL6]|uniref:hypothetical protein n=1 Tax=Sulfurovum sp. TSL6 TaxID=2826995 RepID=UPI001CC44BFB|nr:hypothetical protein [Sulfurovum sp. TSL6]GIU01382.1 hypothetical protein TSL6_18880 [Sulfurovum sp. TSL6]